MHYRIIYDGDISRVYTNRATALKELLYLRKARPKPTIQGMDKWLKSKFKSMLPWFYNMAFHWLAPVLPTIQLSRKFMLSEMGVSIKIIGSISSALITATNCNVVVQSNVHCFPYSKPKAASIPIEWVVWCLSNTCTQNHTHSSKMLIMYTTCNLVLTGLDIFMHEVVLWSHERKHVPRLSESEPVGILLYACKDAMVDIY